MWNMYKVQLNLEILENEPFSRYWKAVVFGCNELNSPEGHSTELKLTTQIVWLWEIETLHSSTISAYFTQLQP